MKRNILCVIGAALALTVAAAAAAPSDPVVAVAGGQVKGRALESGAYFKGIPYAAPPVGDLRWHETMPVKPWSGVREAGEYGAPCAQIAAGWNDKVAAMASEDCLFVNIWTPEWPSKAKKPVMFWIHGGANMGGSSLGAAGSEPPFDGTRLASRGVVVVTINYRLGIFGYMAHPELTAESTHKASGNYGILDQVAALKWVRDNVAKFGGDPANVTVFGQSAGAHDTGLLMTSPLAKGLFHRAIGESGSVIIGGELTPARQVKEQAGVALAAKMGAPATGAIPFLRKLSTADVLKASPSYAGGGDLRPEPDIDGYAITRLPAEVFRSSEAAAVPLIIGNNGRERTTAGGPEGLKKAIEEYYGSLAPKATKVYAEVDNYPPHGNANAQFSTDTMFRCAAVTIAGWQSAKHTVYEYEFTQAPEPRGATHSWELQYMFGNLLAGQANNPLDRKVSDQMQTYWVNFAKTGDPNGGGLPVWPRHEATKKAYLDFTGDGPVVRNALRAAGCELFGEKLKQEMAK